MVRNGLVNYWYFGKFENEFIHNQHLYNIDLFCSRLVLLNNKNHNLTMKDIYTILLECKSVECKE